MGFLQGAPLPDIKTTETRVDAAPEYYTNYLTGLSGAASTAMGKTPGQSVAGYDPMQNTGYGMLPTAATSYMPGLQAAQATAGQAAQGITPERIQELMNPYTSNVVNEMGRLSQENMQRNVLPTMKAGFVGTGGLGGQRYATVEVEIYTLVAHELQLAQAGALAVAMLLLTGAVALGYAALEQRLSAPARADGVAPTRPDGLRHGCAVAAALAVLLIFCAAPVIAILLRVASAGTAVWGVLLEPETLLALWNTLRFTLAATLLATALGLMHALAARRSVWLRAAALLPFLVSPVTVALGLLLLYPQWSASLLLLVSAYAVLAYPFVAKSIGAALDSLPHNLLQAARTLGAGPWRCFWRVTLPLVAPSLRRGMAFAAATAIGEFAVTLFLSRPEWVTLTTLIYQRLGRPGDANRDAALALCALLMALALAAFSLIEQPVARPLRAGPSASRTRFHA